MKKCRAIQYLDPKAGTLKEIDSLSNTLLDKTLLNMLNIKNCSPRANNYQSAYEKAKKATYEQINNASSIVKNIGIILNSPELYKETGTAVLIPTKQFIESLGLDLKKLLFECIPWQEHVHESIANSWSFNKKGMLGAVNLYQQQALLQAIIEKYPVLDDVIGFYDHHDSEYAAKVVFSEYKPVLRDGSEPYFDSFSKYNKLIIHKFFTGESYVTQFQHDHDFIYAREGLITKPIPIGGYYDTFCTRINGTGYFEGDSPDVGNYPSNVMVLGVYINHAPD